jgi:ubiquitin carboxyl-terminal hydrolase 22/27/51
MVNPIIGISLAEDLFLPIGMYNLGNTCYVSATLQCLIHCKPLRELFLHDLAHPYQSCRALRLESNKTTCLACELDKIFLEYYGSAVGIDAIAALEEHLEMSSHATPTDAKEQAEISSFATPTDAKEQAHATRGHPIIPASILAESWRNRGMIFLASHGQQDAQEYFNAFVDCLATHTLAYPKCAQDMRQAVQKTQIKRLHAGNENLCMKSDTGKSYLNRVIRPVDWKVDLIVSTHAFRFHQRYFQGNSQVCSNL